MQIKYLFNAQIAPISNVSHFYLSAYLPNIPPSIYEIKLTLKLNVVNCRVR